MTGTAKHSGMRVLKAGPKRTVLLMGTGAGPMRVIKRFHSPGIGGHRLLGAPGDLRRAASEARALRRAQAAGLPVPTPNKVERSEEGGWELSMSAVPDAQTLDEILLCAFSDTDGPNVWPPSRLQRLAERIAALLRQVETAGFLHADPHPANVIIDSADELCIVDLARSRVQGKPAAVRRGLLRALSRLREACPRSFRRRIAAAWFGAAATPEWSRRVEQEATALRIYELKARVRVWLRSSSATEVRAGFDGSGTAAWVKGCPRVAPAGWTTKRQSGSADGTAQIWETLVRAKLHGIPACEPRAIALQPPHAVEYDLPSEPSALEPKERRRAEARLLDRGLRAVAPLHDGDPFIRAPGGIALVAPYARLLEVPQGRSLS